MIKNVITIITLLTCSLIYSQDITYYLDGNNFNYSSEQAIAGFQFSHDGCVEGASGGASEDNTTSVARLNYIFCR